MFRFYERFSGCEFCVSLVLLCSEYLLCSQYTFLYTIKCYISLCTNLLICRMSVIHNVYFWHGQELRHWFFPLYYVKRITCNFNIINAAITTKLNFFKHFFLPILILWIVKYLPQYLRGMEVHSTSNFLYLLWISLWHKTFTMPNLISI